MKSGSLWQGCSPQAMTRRPQDISDARTMEQGWSEALGKVVFSHRWQNQRNWTAQTLWNPKDHN